MGSSLVASAVTESSLVLGWDAAVDNVGVDSYNIYQVSPDPGLVGSTDGLTLSLTVLGLDPDTSYIFGVEAVDAALNESTGGPTETVTTSLILVSVGKWGFCRLEFTRRSICLIRMRSS